jgi:hypothetical protein
VAKLKLTLKVGNNRKLKKGKKYTRYQLDNCQRKTKYESPSKAHEAVVRLEHERFYRCEVCGHYHTTSKRNALLILPHSMKMKMRRNR